MEFLFSTKLRAPEGKNCDYCIAYEELKFLNITQPFQRNETRSTTTGWFAQINSPDAGTHPNQTNGPKHIDLATFQTNK